MTTLFSRSPIARGTDMPAATLEAMEERIAELTERVGELAGRLARASASGAEGHGRKVGRLAGDAAEFSFDRLGEAGRGAMAIERRLEQTVRRHPVEAIGIAVGLGCLLALIARPR